ncbi:MAG: type II toxin-antitoxin system HicB family antitoxin [Terriglobales bacterium]
MAQPKKKGIRMASPALERAHAFSVEFDREEDGRWIAEVPELPGVMVYGNSKEDALCKVEALAYRVIADRIEEERAPKDSVRFAIA